MTDAQEPRPLPARLYWSVAIVADVLGNLLAAGLWLPLLSHPPGSSLRPMMQSYVLLWTAFATFGFGGMSSMVLLSKPFRRRAAWVPALLSLTPYFVGVGTAKWVFASKHFVFSP